MADPATYRPRTSDIPEGPGVYRFRDADGRVIYVGKAKSLRQRLTSYFADLAQLHPRTQSMVTTAAGVEWTLVANEVEALQLEYSWIKEFDPRFNVKYRDDKSYPYLAVTMGEEFPRVQVLRGAKRKGTRYFGPYAHAWAIRETVDLLLRVFPVRTCSSGVFKRAHQVGRPCLLGYIDKCSAPCVGRVSAAEHRALAEDFCDFMAGQTQRFVKRLEQRMREAAAELDYERAARLRDDIGALTKAMAKSAVVLPDGTDADVFALAEDDLEASVQVFHVRDGRVRGQRGWIVEKVEDVTTADLVEHLLQQVYGGLDGGSGQSREAAGGDAAIPREVLVPVLPPSPAEVEHWLQRMRGGRVTVRVPQRGDKRALLGTVADNARSALALHKTRRAGDLTTRSRALTEIQEALGLADAPLRIECYDVSNIQGQHVVASMVVFEDGLPRKSDYRRFIVRGRPDLDGAAAAAGEPLAGQPGTGEPAGARGPDDLAALSEVLTRRFRRYLAERSDYAEPELGESSTAEAAEALAPIAGPGADGESGPGADGESGRGADGALGPGPTGGPEPGGSARRRFAYPPNLVIVDGGAPQVAAAARVLAELGIDDVALAGLAKRLEEVWLPGEDQPLVLPRHSEGMYLLQRVRDEAHRFAIAHHRQRRSRAMTTSELDAVPGLGPARKKALLKHFGSVKKLRGAAPEEIAQVRGVGPALAEAVCAALHSAQPGPVIDTATGEIID